jgi:hypothetical protein
MATFIAFLRAFWAPIAVCLAILALLLALNQCEKRRNQAAQNRVNEGQLGARVESGGDAVNTVAAAGEREAASEQLTRENEREIRNAEGASDPVNNAVRGAGLRALCLRDSYRNDPKCKLLNAAPR